MKLPQNYHVDYDESKEKYYWYYLGRKEGKKDYEHPKMFKTYDDAISDAVRHYKSKNK